MPRAVAAALALLALAAAARLRSDGPPTSARLAAAAAGVPADVARLVLDLAPFRYRVATAVGGAGVALRGADGGVVELGPEDAGGLRFFPLGDRVIAWGGGAARIWDAASGDLAQVLAFDAAACDVFPQGDRAVCCSYADGCLLFDAASGAVVGQAQQHGASGVEVFPSGDRLLTWGSEGHATLVGEGGETICRLIGHTEDIVVGRVFPGGERVITGSLDGRAVIWDARSCSLRFDLVHKASQVIMVSILQGGDLVAVMTSFGSVKVWNALTGEALRVLVNPSTIFSSLPAMGIDCSLRRSCLAVNALGEIVIWHAPTGFELRDFQTYPNLTDHMAVSPSGDVLAACAGVFLWVWDPRSGAPRGTFAHDAPRASFDSSCLVSIGLGSVLDPRGFGSGVSWRDLPW